MCHRVEGRPGVTSASRPDSSARVTTPLSDHQARRATFERLWHAHHGAVLAFALRRTHRDRAADVVEETFLAAWRRLDELPAEARVWLYGIARGVLANDRRAQRRRGMLVRRLLGSAPAVAPDPSDQAGFGPAWDAFWRLSPRDREVVALVAWEELTAAQAAAVLACSEGAFRMRLHRARTRLARLREEIAGESAASPPHVPLREDAR